jgi:frataxin-like iron-binding protein CyaY
MAVSAIADFLEYSKYQFLLPPRPDNVIDRIQLPWFEKQGYVLQYKKNGTNNVMAISPDREIIAMQRHNIPHKLWAPSAHTIAPFRDLPGGWYVFVAELLHNKVKDGATKGLRDINYINEILVADSQHLTGTTFIDRQALLAKMFGADKLPIAASGSHYIIDEHTWLARNHTTNFSKIFAGLTAAEDEGVVLKQASARLKPCTTATANSAWQVKLRLPRTSYEVFWLISAAIQSTGRSH